MTSISKPGLILPSQIASTFFISHAANGAMIIAPRNIGASTIMLSVSSMTAVPDRLFLWDALI